METSQLAERLSALDRVGDDAGERGSGVDDLAELVSIAQQVNRLIAVESAQFDATGVFTARSYRSPAAFLSTEGRLGQGSARRFVSCGRILGQFELLAATVEAGEITFDHVAVFARLLPASASDHRWACVVRDEAVLVDAAKTDTATAFSQRCLGWRHSVDPDDEVTEQLSRETHGMTTTNLDGWSAELTLRGTAGEIEQLRSAINNATVQAWRARAGAKSAVSPIVVADDHDRGDVGRGSGPDDAGRGNGGDGSGGPERNDNADHVDNADNDVSAGLLANQPTRGRLQLGAALRLLARSTRAGTASVWPLVTVVVDWATFQLEVQRYARGTAMPVDVFAPEFRCGTIGGHPVPPSEAFVMALQGEIQRCVIGAPSRKIDLGRSQRLFNGAGRHAVRVRDRTCVHPHCDLPSVWADIDHIDEWQHLGLTDTANAQALCRFHHVRKHQQQEAA